MVIWLQIKRWLQANLFVLNGKNLLVAFAGYVFTAWLLLFIASEHDLTSSITTFAYYLVVTASTVDLMLLKFYGCRRMLERKWSKPFLKGFPFILEFGKINRTKQKKSTLCGCQFLTSVSQIHISRARV